MSIQRPIWLGAIVTAISAAVSVATVCVVVPIVVNEKSVAEEAAIDNPFAGQVDQQQPVLAVEQDHEAIAAIKKGLDIDLFSGTVLDGERGTVFNESAESPTADAAAVENSAAEQIASEALLATAEQLRSEGQQGAAELVHAAAEKLRNSTARQAPAKGSTRSR